MSARPRKAWTAALAFAAAAGISAVEIETSFGLGTMHFPWGLAESAASKTFPADRFHFGGGFDARIPIGEDASVAFGVERDQSLRHLAYGLVSFERGVTRITAGPYAGFLNETAVPFSAGLSTSIRLQWPGIAYVSVRSDGGLAIGIVGELAEPQVQAELSGGLYVKNAIVSLSVSGKRFEGRDAEGERTADSLNLYMLQADIFKKNIPFAIALRGGYRQRSLSYLDSGTSYSLASLVLGFKLSVQAASWIGAYGSLDTGVLNFGLGGLLGKGPSSRAFLFDAEIGARLDTDLLVQALREAREARELRARLEAEEKGADGPPNAP